jgi:hypothetical protein
MTSIQFHIDPTALRILHGDRADGFQRRRERDRDRERVRDAYGLAMRGDDVEAVIRQRDSVVAPAREGLRMYNDQMMRERMGNNGGPAAAAAAGGMRIAGAAAQFVAVGGRRLNLDK